MDEEYIPDENTSDMVIQEVFNWLESGVVAIVSVVLLFTFVGRLIGVNGESMFPTLQNNDRLVATHLLYTPTQGDIVVVTKPNSRNEPLIKRVVATGGQELDIDFAANTVKIDGKIVDEPYIREPMRPDSYSHFSFPLVVPEGYVFIMGDNRNNSWDSRIEEVGFVDERYILGKVVFRILPYDNMGTLE